MCVFKNSRTHDSSTSGFRPCSGARMGCAASTMRGAGGHALDLVAVPPVFDAVGGGGVLEAGGAALRTSGPCGDHVGGRSPGGRGWATLGRAMDRGTLVWRFRVESHSLSAQLLQRIEHIFPEAHEITVSRMCHDHSMEPLDRHF